MPDESRKNAPTERQLAYLESLAVDFDASRITKQEASWLIDNALREKRSKELPEEKHLAKLRRFGAIEQLPQGASKYEAFELLDRISGQPASRAQLQIAARLGLKVSNVEEFTTGSLDDFLKLAEREPTTQDLEALASLCIVEFGGTALDARLILAVAMIFKAEYDSYDDDDQAVARACIVAARDEDFQSATISAPEDMCSLDHEIIRWPKEKLDEWWLNAGNAVR